MGTLLKILSPSFWAGLAGILISILPAPVQAQSSAVPVPSAPQLRWQNYEQTMFIHYNPTTWTNREYDDLSLPLSRMNPDKLNTDQWCQAAKSWGAKLIILVAKHTGGIQPGFPAAAHRGTQLVWSDTGGVVRWQLYYRCLGYS